MCVGAGFQSRDILLMQRLYLLPVLNGHPYSAAAVTFYSPVFVFLYYFYL